MSDYLTPKTIDKFWSKVDSTSAPDGCWQWTGIYAKSTGYGLFLVSGGKLVSAHRIAFEIQNGDIPAGLFVLHHCDNRVCVRGDHLFVGTQAENMADMVAKGRAAMGRNQGTWTHPESRAKGERHGRAILTLDQVRAIRRQIAEGIPQAQIARSLGVSKSTICAINTGRLWRDSA